jgi:hypothetical protein
MGLRILLCSGNPENDPIDITSAMVALQDTLTGEKHLGVQVKCVNGSVYTVYKCVIELIYDLDPW